MKTFFLSLILTLNLTSISVQDPKSNIENVKSKIEQQIEFYDLNDNQKTFFNKTNEDFLINLNAIKTSDKL